MPEPETSTPWRDIAAHVAPYRGQLAQGAALLVVVNMLDKSIPWLIKHAVDDLTSGALQSARDFALATVAFAIAMALVRVRSRTRVFEAGRDVEFDLRNRILAKLQELGPSFFRRMPTGETMSRAINDLSQVRAMVGFGLLNLVNSTLAYGFALAFMFAMSTELTLWALAPYPLLVFLTRWLARLSYQRSHESQQALGVLASRVQESLSGIRIVRAFAAELEQAMVFETANQAALEKNMALVVLRGLMWPVLTAVGSVGTLLVLWRGSALMGEGVISAGELVAFIAYSEGLKWPTTGLGYILSVLQRGRASYARIREILTAEPDVAEPANPVIPDGPGALSVSHLSFEHEGRRVLDDICFDVPAGSSLAILGRTGSGRSTLAALLPRLLPAPEGTVQLDGVDVTRLSLRPLRRRVGFAQQEPFLFSTSVRRNIGYLCDDPDAPENLERIRHAADEACVLSEVEELADGLDTVVGERGVQLSGGQKQRIALARALLSEPRVLVMDDPLSAVDAGTEARILEALERARHGRTFVLVTNRVAAAARCDRVLVLDGGRIVESGDHESLSIAGGVYAELADRQRLEQELSVL